MKRRIWLLLIGALLICALPLGALAAKPPQPTIRLGGKYGFMKAGSAVTLRPRLSGVDRDSITFSSSDAAVASISAEGRIQALAPGRTVITVAGGGVKARCGVVVLPESISLQAGEKFTLPRAGVERYAVKDKAVASIDRSGVVTGRKAGSTLVGVKYGRQMVTVPLVVTGESAQPEQGSKAAKLYAAASTDQIVLVEHQSGSKATLSVHEKKDGVWKQLLETTAYVGRNGIGKTKEGDKKTPTGTYNLNTPFGILADPGANMPYTKVTKYHYWCGSSNTKYYNQLVDSRKIGRSYTSSDEHLIDYKGVYNYCMFIDYNAAGEAGKGSCIFLHCTGSNKYTAGCVAISEANMKKIIQWARPGVKIVIQ